METNFSSESRVIIMSILGLIWPILVIELILKVVSLRDLFRRSPSEVKGGKLWIWAVFILLISTVGPVLYLVWGRNDE